MTCRVSSGPRHLCPVQGNAHLGWHHPGQPCKLAATAARLPASCNSGSNMSRSGSNCTAVQRAGLLLRAELGALFHSVPYSGEVAHKQPAAAKRRCCCCTQTTATSCVACTASSLPGRYGPLLSTLPQCRGQLPLTPWASPGQITPLPSSVCVLQLLACCVKSAGAACGSRLVQQQARTSGTGR